MSVNKNVFFSDQVKVLHLTDWIRRFSREIEEVLVFFLLVKTHKCYKNKRLPGEINRISTACCVLVDAAEEDAGIFLG